MHSILPLPPPPSDPVLRLLGLHPVLLKAWFLRCHFKTPCSDFTAQLCPGHFICRMRSVMICWGLVSGYWSCSSSLNVFLLSMEWTGASISGNSWEGCNWASQVRAGGRGPLLHNSYASSKSLHLFPFSLCIQEKSFAFLCSHSTVCITLHRFTYITVCDSPKTPLCSPVQDTDSVQ